MNTRIEILQTNVGICGSRLMLGVLLVALELSFSSFASADAVVFSCDGPSLQQAVNQGGLVVLFCLGNITLTQTIEVSVDTTITGTSPLGPLGALHTISGGNTVGPLFHVPANVTLNLDHLNITNGSANIEGGGVLNDGTLNVAHCTFSNNTAGSVSIAGSGGAISNHGMLAVAHTLFEKNAALGGFNSRGGAIYNNGTVIVNSSELNSNLDFGLGGAVFNDVNGTLTVTNGKFSGNDSEGFAAGVFNMGISNVTNSTFSGNAGNVMSNVGGTVMVISSTFSGNGLQVFQDKGTLSNENFGDRSGTVTITDSTFANNSEAGIVNRSTLIVDYSTFSGNSFPPGHGIMSFNIDNQGPGTATLSDSALSTGKVSGLANCSSSITVDAGYNLDDDGSCGFSAANNSFSNQQTAGLGTLADNGGPTSTIAPLADSPLRDKIPSGTNNCGTAGTPGEFDQRGVQRSADGDGCEIGSYEIAPNLVPPNPPSCVGSFTGAFMGNLIVTSPASCVFVGGSISGNVRLFGGTLALSNVTVEGNVEVTGGTISIGPSTNINGNLEIHNLDSTSTGNTVCGANIKGNLTFHDNAAAIAIGANPLAVCAGNTISSNVEVHDNAVPTQILDNTITGNLDVHNNTAPTQVIGNAANNLTCHNNLSITGGPNPGSINAQGQCFQFNLQ